MAWYSNVAQILAQAAPNEAAGGGDLTGTLNLIVALAVVIGSFVLGAVLARTLRLPDYSFKLGIVAFSLIASLAICYFGWPPKRGIDLSGGVVLVYEVDTGLSNSNWMPAAVARINERLNAEGGERLEARPVGENQIEIVVPDGVGVAGVEDKVATLRDAADLVMNLESRRTEDGQTVLLYKAEPGQLRDLNMGDMIAAVSRRINPGGVKELTIRQYGAEQLEVIIPEVEEREVEQIKKKISTSGLLEFRIVANPTDDKDVIKAALRTKGADVYIGGRRVGRWVKMGDDLLSAPPAGATTRPAPGGGQEILARIDPFNVDGRYLTRAAQGYDERGGLAVEFSFDSVGAERFRQLTSRNLPDPTTGLERNLGIVLDNMMISAPTIRSTISGRGQITGSFTEDYVSLLVGVLNAGRLPATLRHEPISEQRISSQLGDDTIRAGANAMIISTAAILLFMLVYYRFAGLVADIAVTLNVVITVAMMILIKAAFTLPGLAGLVLTVGMAVDANVLIYERIREESQRGASLRMAIRNGFSRAMSTIIDSHVTTLASGVVLYIVGTDQLKGFAVTLIIGLLMSLFTSVFVARVIFDVFERKGWIRQLTMMQLIRPTNFDFIRWRTPAIVGSALIIGVGLVAGAMRGKELLDIDFTGGSSVQLLFDQGHERSIADVRAAVEGLPDVAVSSVGESRLAFKIDTSESNVKRVQSELQEIFGDALKTYHMSFGDIGKIEPQQQAAPGDATGASPPAASASPAANPPAEPDAGANDATGAEPSDAAPSNEGRPSEESPADAPSAVLRRPRSVEVAAGDDATALVALLQEEPAAEQPTVEAAPADEPPADEPAAEEPAAEQPAAEPAADEAARDAPRDRGDVEFSGSMVGGSTVELTFPEEIAHEPLRELIQEQINAHGWTGVAFQLLNPAYQPGSEARYSAWTLETTLSADQTRELLEAIQSRLAKTPVFPGSSEIGGKVAGDTQLTALYAILASLVMIVAYIWFRFQNVIFGLAAVLALVHDVLITIAFLAMSYFVAPYLGFLMVDPFKISLAVMAALLMIIGYSINDKIVVFDRIREVRGKSPDLTPEMINLSVNQTLSRTLLTGGAVIVACIILYIVGGPGIHGFSFAMLIGVIAGTYSSIYIAAPVLLWLKKPEPSKVPSGAGMPAAAARGR